MRIVGGKLKKDEYENLTNFLDIIDDLAILCTGKS
jgi:hypothetical protein